MYVCICAFAGCLSMHQQMACTEIPDFIPYSPGQRPKIENAKLNKNNLKCVLSIFGANEGRA